MELLTVKQVAAKFPIFKKESSLRWLLFHREENGLARAVVKVGGRVFIDEEAFQEWLESKRENINTEHAI